MKISQKGLFLVSVPLIFELGFVALLVVALNQADLAARREARSKQIVAETAELSKVIIDAGFALLTWQYYRSNTDLMKRYSEDVGEVPSILRRLDDLTANNPKQHVHAMNIRTYANSVLYLFDRYGRNPIDLSGQLKALISIDGFRHKMELTLSPLLNETKLLSNEEQAAQLTDPHAQDRLRSIIWALIIAGVLFNVLLTLAMAIFFSRSITQRLRILGDNALRVARKEPLHKPVSGSDEIASLDRIFREMADALATADRQKQEFVNMITHDLRTPLTSLQGNIALLLEGHYGALSEKAQERLHIAEHSATRLIKLISELLDIERIEAGMFVLSLQEVQLNDLINEAVVAIQSFAEQKQIAIEVSSEDQLISADPTRLVQVLVNLLSNAVKFSPPNAVVKIRAEKNGTAIAIRVTDNGPGIAPDDLKRVFDRFQQAQNTAVSKVAGSGLGLAICKAIVVAHGGRIGVDSQLGHGSTFWFELPVNAASEGSPKV